MRLIRARFLASATGLSAAALLAAALPSCDEADTDASAAGPAPANANAPPPWFERVTDSGIDFVHHTGATGKFLFPEIAVGGVCMFDYDNDGLLDLYFVQSGALDPAAAVDPARAGDRLYRNLGNWKFEDVTERAGMDETGYSMGCACGDYDNDGHVDLYVTNVGTNVMYRNNGDGTFTDVTATSKTNEPGWSSSAAFADYNADGLLDLFVVNYIHWSRETELTCFSARGPQDYCSPKNYNAPARATLYRNNGDGSFEDVSVALGLDRAFGNGLGVTAGDFNRDGILDFYVANDGTPNQLWIGNGSTFIDRAPLAGCAVNQHGWAEASMGVAAHDVDDDGDLDLFMTHLEEETNTIYRNNGDGTFIDDTARSGMAKMSKGFTGFGMAFADFDHDGYSDVYVANGRVKRGNVAYDANDPYAEPDHVIRGKSDGLFEEVIPRGGTAELVAYTGRGAAFGDLDNDGDVDVVVANRDAPPLLLRNVAGTRGNWIQFLVLDEHGRECTGATVAVRTSARTQTRSIGRGYSYCASHDPRVHFGLGSTSQVDEVTVRWIGGRTETFNALAANGVYILKAGSPASAQARSSE